MNSKIIGCLFLVLSLTSCKKWLDVKPTDRLAGDELFKSREGFLMALNGIYVDMTAEDVYGKRMTAADLDVMAGYYYMEGTTHLYNQHANFEYTADRPRDGFEAIWNKTYKNIANVNQLLKACDEQEGILQEPYFGLVKGEALALRAMLHFDMLRIFGPIWTEADKATPAIPYKTSATVGVSPLLGSEAVMEKVLADLTEARRLLEVDPVITEGVRHTASPTGVNDLYYRQYRLNHFAVRALMARAYLWKGDNANAYTTSTELLAQVQATGKVIFPNVSVNAATGTNGAALDRIFASEVMFSLYTITRPDMFNSIFAPTQEELRRLSFNKRNDVRTRLVDLYGNVEDYRYKAWLSLSAEDVTVLTHMKYSDVANSPGLYMIPLIRLSEVRLIAAETSPDLAEGTAYFNAVRTSRNTLSQFPADATGLKTAITAEFRREFIGEGQMFFYYKRNAMPNIANHTALTGTKNMPLANYVVPLPLSETSLRQNQ
ncbi:MAG: RagB/SusD family nutrient uptake outer membrane protein [Candidatus Pseudobacter hemicellulosilyticus]|uniref:RagB/SusD family nutrient uptake outer membrane protein n=1 Tax=Candidatus Pseudobacter hemicellulosilyticus TaxID=3121375 RepID=A0AAJ5WPX9_9BACT|nr:MAG: RagB/SusD family nutrient uptake outer membrane protein [Pseudobacter sp.]